MDKILVEANIILSTTKIMFQQKTQVPVLINVLFASKFSLS